MDKNITSDVIDVSDLIGVPFVPFGRDAKTGLDCYGLVMEVARRYGKPLRDVARRWYTVEEATREADMRLNLVVTVELMQPCIVLEFRAKDNRLHAGITIDSNGNFLHATENQGVRMSAIKSTAGYLKMVRAYEIVQAKDYSGIASLF